MAYREVSRIEIPEIIRRWQAEDSQRKIALGTGLSRDTIAQCAEPASTASARRQRRRHEPASTGPAGITITLVLSDNYVCRSHRLTEATHRWVCAGTTPMGLRCAPPRCWG